MAKFCVQCGTARPEGARFCGQCGWAFPEVAIPRAGTSVGPSTWSSMQSSWWISGCFNVESGSGTVSTAYFEGCDCHTIPRDAAPCSICGRTRSSAEEFATGQGDGVYPVFVLEDSARHATGAIAFFVPDWALGVEEKSKAPEGIAEVAKPVLVGAIETPGMLFFSDAYTGFEDTNITVDVEVPAGQYEVIAWLAEVPILREHGIEPFVRPIAVGVYGAALMSALGQVARVDRDPATYEMYRPWNTMMWGVMSHKEPGWATAARYNYADDTKRGDEERATSWMLQAAMHGDDAAMRVVADLLAATDHNSLALRQRLLAMRGQGTTALVSPVIDSHLVDRAMSVDMEVRNASRQTIIGNVDVLAMRACADRAGSLGDEADAEFWWLEIATAPASAGEDAIVDGVVGLCDRILLRQGRYEEAELYCRHLLTRDSDNSRHRGRAMLDRVVSDFRERGVRRLVASDAWRRVDLAQPAVSTTDQQVHFDRLYAYLEATSGNENLQRLANAHDDDFMSYVTGWLIGFAGSDGAVRCGVVRETAAHVLREWLLDRGSRQLAKDAGPRSPGLTKTLSGL